MEKIKTKFPFERCGFCEYYQKRFKRSGICINKPKKIIDIKTGEESNAYYRVSKLKYCDDFFQKH